MELPDLGKVKASSLCRTKRGQLTEIGVKPFAGGVVEAV